MVAWTGWLKWGNHKSSSLSHSSQEFPCAHCSAQSSLPCCLAYIHVNISFISTGIFTTKYFPLLGRHCWHFWCYLTMHHFLSNHAQQALQFPRVSIHFLGDHPAWEKRPKLAVTSDLGLNSVKHQNCPFTGGCEMWEMAMGCPTRHRHFQAKGAETERRNPHSLLPCTSWGMKDQEGSSEAEHEKQGRKGAGLMVLIVFVPTLIYLIGYKLKVIFP